MMEPGFRKIFPKLEKYIKHVSIGTPLTTNNFLATDQGECYGLGATPARYRSNDLGAHTECPNVVMTVSFGTGWWYPAIVRLLYTAAAFYAHRPQASQSTHLLLPALFLPSLPPTGHTPPPLVLR